MFYLQWINVNFSTAESEVIADLLKQAFPHCDYFKTAEELDAILSVLRATREKASGDSSTGAKGDTATGSSSDETSDETVDSVTAGVSSMSVNK